MSVDGGPTLQRRWLGRELKRCREAAGLTQEQVSRQFEWHAAKVTRIETARVTVTPRDVRDLLELYGVTDAEYRQALVVSARSSRQRAWWAEFRDIVKPGSFIALEAEASAMRNWEPVVVPGLLQTEKYMRALFATVSPGRQQSVERAVSLRLTRQRRLTGDAPLELVAIIDESVLHRPIGGASVMADQLRHLISAAGLPTVTLRILPYSVGEHPLLGTSLALLEFPGAADLDVAYVEGMGRSPDYIRRPTDVSHHRRLFERLAGDSCDEATTVRMLEDLLTASGSCRGALDGSVDCSATGNGVPDRGVRRLA